MESEDSEIIGYVVEPEDPPEDTDNPNVTVCPDCWEEMEGEEKAQMDDSGAYGSEIPYPPCWECGEIMRPGERIECPTEHCDFEIQHPFMDVHLTKDHGFSGQKAEEMIEDSV